MKYLLTIITLSILSIGCFAGGQSISSAHEGRASNVQVSNAGIVVKVLSDVIRAPVTNALYLNFHQGRLF
jgi:hypothetical protein